MLSLKTLPQATAQEVFDHVARHLLTQNEKAVASDGHCRYREGKLRCAAGCLITDDEYCPAFERYSWGQLAGNRDVPQMHVNLIQDLQAVHDDESPSAWVEYLNIVARYHTLKGVHQ